MACGCFAMRSSTSPDLPEKSPRVLLLCSLSLPIIRRRLPQPRPAEEAMQRTLWLSLAIAFCALISVASAPPTDGQQPKKDDGYVAIFDGQTLKGWHVSAKTGHSATSKHKSGGRWVVEDGAIVGSQDVPGNGGIIITDKQDYKNFEVVLEMRNDFGPDSGLF